MVIHQSIGYRTTAFLQKWSFPNVLKEAKRIVQSSPKFDVTSTTICDQKIHAMTLRHFCYQTWCHNKTNVGWVPSLVSKNHWFQSVRTELEPDLIFDLGFSSDLTFGTAPRNGIATRFQIFENKVTRIVRVNLHLIISFWSGLVIIP